MNDRFRFRAWDPTTKELVEVRVMTCLPGRAPLINAVDAAHVGLDVDLSSSPGVVLMQCTGLKDRHGKLIYEGDVVESNCGTMIPSADLRRAIVEWHEQGGAFVRRSGTTPSSFPQTTKPARPDTR